MKSLHRADLYGWSAFDESRNVDFNGTLLVRDGGANVAFDPMPLSVHDRNHIVELGGIDWVLISNADHVRDAVAIAGLFNARIAAPAGDRERPDLRGVPVALWLDDGDALDFGVTAYRLDGSKTPGELAFLVDDDTLIVGDLVRGQRAGHLNLLPDPKLEDKDAALASVRRLAELPHLVAVIVGDGQSVFRGARARLAELLETA
jgi:glyoxylase-like metal-dependent hydrolase (beta-lactamase superfamily II)